MTRVRRAVFQERSGQLLRTDQRGGETSSAGVIDESLAVLLHAVASWVSESSQLQ